uniref:CSON014295 protein n=2 Tax=Culicoides sonorensis TaxID=179676 RepID=A0A336KR98_CULSO
MKSHLKFGFNTKIMADLPPELDFSNFEDAINGDFDVVDEVGGDSEEEVSKDKSSEKSKDGKTSRSRTRSIRHSRERSHNSRNRSRSPRHRVRSRSRSRDRTRKRSPPVKRRSPGKKLSFLEEIQNKCGNFEELEKVRNEKEGHSSRPNRNFNNFRNNRQQQQQKPYNNYQNNMNNGMPPNQMMMMNPEMCNPQMMNMAMPQMGMPPMGMPFQNPMMPMPGPADFNNGMYGMGANMDFQPQMMVPQSVPVPQPVPQPVPPVNGPIINAVECRNASPPPSEIGNITSKLLAQNKMSLSEYLETQAGSNKSSTSKTIEARPLKERVSSRLKAAIHRLNHASDQQFELKFLHVPPSLPSDSADAIGASPVLPSKHNPVFGFSTKNKEAVQKCRPYPLITPNIEPLLRQLGIDESDISRHLVPSSSENSKSRNNFDHTFESTSHKQPILLHPRVPTNEIATQTPPLECGRCQNRYNNLLNTSTQTQVIETHSISCETLETDFCLAKIRLKTWEKDQTKKIKKFQNDYRVSDEEDEMRGTYKRVGPPGYRERPRKDPDNSSYRGDIDDTYKNYYAQYHGSKY